MKSGDGNTPENNANERPEIRVGDAERSAAVDALGMHFADGRLTIDEFEQRTGAAATAKTRGDLAPLFVDLPGGMSGLPAQPTITSTTSPLQADASAALPADTDIPYAMPYRSLTESENELAELRSKGRLVSQIDSVLWSVGFILFFTLLFTGITDFFWLALVSAGIGSVVARAVVGFDDADEETYEVLSKEEQRERRRRLKLAAERRRELER